jgi:hypothetical protein
MEDYSMDTNLLVNALLDEEWLVTVNAQADALPDTLADWALPYDIGAMDAEDGKEADPLQYYARLGDIEQYLIGYKETKGELPTLVNGVDVAAELELLQDGMADDLWHAQGGW